MLDGLIQQFAGGGGDQMAESDLHGGVGQMLSAAPSEHSAGAIGEALSTLGGSGFGQSVAQGAATGTPEERSGLGGMFMSAISQGGGSPGNVLSQLGIGGGGSGFNPSELGSLAQYAGDNHAGALSGILGSQLGGGRGGGAGSMLKLLGNPMVRTIGMNLAKRLM